MQKKIFIFVVLINIVLCNTTYLHAFNFSMIKLKNQIKLPFNSIMDTSKIYKQHETEEPAIPFDGQKDFYKYISKNIIVSKKARRQGYGGRIFISFVVEKDGKLTNIKISGDRNIEEEQTIKLLKQYKPWKPAKIKNVIVRQKVAIPMFICVH